MSLFLLPLGHEIKRVSKGGQLLFLEEVGGGGGREGGKEVRNKSRVVTASAFNCALEQLLFLHCSHKWTGNGSTRNVQ